MSATETKKPGGVGRREARALQEKKEKRKIRVTTISIVAVLALLFIGALFLNSKITRRNLVAITVGSVDFTAAEYDYFFFSSYFNYSNYINQQMGESAESMLPKRGTPLASQVHDYETGETWADFFKDMALEQMNEIVLYYEEATRNGWEIPEEDRGKTDEEIANMKSTAVMFGYSSVDKFLQEYYGPSINEKSFRKLAEFINFASLYSKYKFDSFPYSNEDLETYYDENKDELDVFTFRYMSITPESVVESDFESAEEYEEALAAAQSDAETKAAEIAAGIISEEDFIAAAREYDADRYPEDDSTLMEEYSGETLYGDYKAWLAEAEREQGDVTSINSESGIYVVYYISRDNNTYLMTEMRQILINRETIDVEEYEHEDDAYNEALAVMESEAKERADSVLAQFIEGGATEEKLIELMEENSDDTTEGGLYTDIYKKMMVPEIDSWLFDPARQIGDYESIRTESYGYHLVYFMGFGKRYCDFTSDSRMREADYAEWKDSLGTPTVTEHWAMRLTRQ
ncbi:MAG: peptidyl-prolyl cis-trans isomerase [Oscillospiraceae bacterium]|jgi:nucleotide-binding universal stress UspA family protein|nr:peptidyl-prolyl cis-trans isomerase [Oscillospiraceae bacterium]